MPQGLCRRPFVSHSSPYIPSNIAPHHTTIMKQKYQFFSEESGKVARLSSIDLIFKPEALLRDFVAQHLRVLFGATCLGTEYQVGTKRIDVVGIAKDGRPVIVECKKDRKAGIVEQITSYYHWLRKQPEFKKLAKRQLRAGSIKIENPRLICLAKDFTDAQLGSWDFWNEEERNFARKIEYVSYDYLAGKVLLLNWVRGDPAGKIQERDNSLSYSLSRCDITHKFFKELSQKIDRLSKDVIQYDSLMIRNFKIGNRVFVCLRPVPRSKEIRVWFRLDPKNYVPADNKRDMTNRGQLAPPSCRLEMRVSNKENDIEEALQLARKACDQAS